MEQRDPSSPEASSKAARGPHAGPSSGAKGATSPGARLLPFPAHLAAARLAVQPETLVQLRREDRQRIVVTAVTSSDGTEHVLSRFGSPVWDLSPLIEPKNFVGHRVCWPTDLPELLVEDAKAALYCSMRRGREGARGGRTGPWSGITLRNSALLSFGLLRYLAKLGVENFGQIHPLQVRNFIDTRTAEGATPNYLNNQLRLLAAAWYFNQELLYPMTAHPFFGEGMDEATGLNDARATDPSSRTGKTPVIPLESQAQLWNHCEHVISNAAAVLDQRDAGYLEPTSQPVTSIRDAVLYMLGVCAGLRNSEAVEVTNACWRQEMHGTVSFSWITTCEHKTSGGKRLDYLVPPQIFGALELLQRYAAPLQKRLAEEARWLERMIAESNGGVLANGTSLAEGVLRLNHVTEIKDHMFLWIVNTGGDHLELGSRVDVMPNGVCNQALRNVAKAAGTEWHLTTHQLRRTWAWNIANSRLGYKGLFFVRWQLKHASVAWSQLYAANPHQDMSLYADIREALIDVKVSKLEEWNDQGAALSGGAGRKMMQTRGTARRNLGELLAATAESITIRHTGHSWCLSETRDCHGQGVYEPTLCADCKQAVIDGELGPMWQTIHMENIRLASIQDCGQAVLDKANRAIRASEQTLRDLGVDVPSLEQASSYLGSLNVLSRGDNRKERE